MQGVMRKKGAGRRWFTYNAGRGPAAEPRSYKTLTKQPFKWLEEPELCTYGLTDTG